MRSLGRCWRSVCSRVRSNSNKFYKTPSIIYVTCLKMFMAMTKEDKEFLCGISDLHVYVKPSVFPNRVYDGITFAKHAREFGYKGFLMKNVEGMNADQAVLTRKLVPGISAFGSIVLNYIVGGLNPDAVEVAIGYGAKMVWMPTIHAKHNVDLTGTARRQMIKEIKRKLWKTEGMYILTRDGEVLPEVLEILDMIADADIILGTGHLSVEEDYALIKAARSAGVKKIIVTHVFSPVSLVPIEDQVKMAKLGAIMELTYSECLPALQSLDPGVIAEAIRKVGATGCVMTSSLGNIGGPHPIEGMRQYIHLMRRNGISDRDINIMTKENPSKLLGLE